MVPLERRHGFLNEVVPVGVLDKEKIDLPCPECGQDIAVTFGDIQKKKSLRYNRCGATIAIDSRAAQKTLKTCFSVLGDMGWVDEYEGRPPKGIRMVLQYDGREKSYESWLPRR